MLMSPSFSQPSSQRFQSKVKFIIQLKNNNETFKSHESSLISQLTASHSASDAAQSQANSHGRSRERSQLEARIRDSNCHSQQALHSAVQQPIEHLLHTIGQCPRCTRQSSDANNKIIVQRFCARKSHKYVK